MEHILQSIVHLTSTFLQSKSCDLVEAIYFINYQTTKMTTLFVMRFFIRRLRWLTELRSYRPYESKDRSTGLAIQQILQVSIGSKPCIAPFFTNSLKNPQDVYWITPYTLFLHVVILWQQSVWTNYTIYIHVDTTKQTIKERSVLRCRDCWDACRVQMLERNPNLWCRL